MAQDVLLNDIASTYALTYLDLDGCFLYFLADKHYAKLLHLGLDSAQIVKKLNPSHYKPKIFQNP
jgi:hypothetical protein